MKTNSELTELQAKFNSVKIVHEQIDYAHCILRDIVIADTVSDADKLLARLTEITSKLPTIKETFKRILQADIIVSTVKNHMTLIDSSIEQLINTITSKIGEMNKRKFSSRLVNITRHLLNEDIDQFVKNCNELLIIVNTKLAEVEQKLESAIKHTKDSTIQQNRKRVATLSELNTQRARTIRKILPAEMRQNIDDIILDIIENKYDFEEDMERLLDAIDNPTYLYSLTILAINTCQLAMFRSIFNQLKMKDKSLLQSKPSQGDGILLIGAKKFLEYVSKPESSDKATIILTILQEILAAIDEKIDIAEIDFFLLKERRLRELMLTRLHANWLDEQKPYSTALYEAAETNQAEICVSILEKLYDTQRKKRFVNLGLYTGQTPYEVALQRGSESVLKILEPFSKSCARNRLFLAFNAVRNGNLQQLIIHLSALDQAVINDVDAYNFTLLHSSLLDCVQDRYEIIAHLLSLSSLDIQKYAKLFQNHERKKERHTALTYTIIQRDMQAAKLIINALRQRNLPIVDFEFTATISVNHGLPAEDIATLLKDSQATTSIKENIVKLALESNRTDINISGVTLSALDHKFHALFSTLKSFDSATNATRIDDIVPDIKLVQTKLNDYNTVGYTLLHTAVLIRCIPLCNVLLKLGSNPNIISFDRTPLYDAIKNDDMSIINLLIDNGVEMDKSTPKGPLLHFAIKQKRPQAASRIITAIAKLAPIIANKLLNEVFERETPLLLAMEMGMNDIVALLHQHGAKGDIQIEGDHRSTAKQFSIQVGNATAFRLFSGKTTQKPASQSTVSNISLPHS